MKRVAGLVIAGLILLLGTGPSWGGPPNPTESDANGNTASGTGALLNVSSGNRNTAFGVGAPEKGYDREGALCRLPAALDDANARLDWGWAPRYNLAQMTEHLLPAVRALVG
jgi:hypothetical protein